MSERRLIMNAEKMAVATEDIANAIYSEFLKGKNLPVVFLGIQTKGVAFGKRIAAKIKGKYGYEAPFGMLDITMYRDDIGKVKNLPRIRETHIPFTLDDKIVILTDDVLQSGRTIRAALDAITDYGRPAFIRLAVLVDRGLREFPIRADYVGLETVIPSEERLRTEWENNEGQRDGVYAVKE